VLGSLLRNAEPEVMDALIQAYKDGDSSRLLSLTGTDSLSIEREEEEEVEESSEEVMSVLLIFYCSNVELHMTTLQVVL
jgi:hypothetical protein